MTTTVTETEATTVNELLTLRIPRGLWADLEETVIQQDRQFLSEVARSLGLPVNEVLRKCLGTGAPQPCPVLWAPASFLTDAPHTCPWWEIHNGCLWRPCPRLRLSPSLPCQIHERCVPCPLTRLGSDPDLVGLPRLKPVRDKATNLLYWYDPADRLPLLCEDGRPVTDRRLVTIQFKGKAILTWAKAVAL
jgi:hypothetical protein